MKHFILLMVFAAVAVQLSAQPVPQKAEPTDPYAGIDPSELPAGTKVIPAYAFYNRDDLVEITIPEGVEVISPYAFYYCENLRKVTLPSTLVSAKGAFPYCNALKEVTCLGIVPPFIGHKPRYGRLDLQWVRSLEQFNTMKLYASEDDDDYDESRSGVWNFYVYDNIDVDDKISFFRDVLTGEDSHTDDPLLPLKFTPSCCGLYNYDTDKNYVTQEDKWPYNYVPFLSYTMRDHILRHPSCTRYELIDGWNHFPAFETFDVEMPSALRVGSYYTLYDNLFNNKPDLTLAVSIDNQNKVRYAGHMSILGGTHSYGNFTLEQDAWQNNIRVYKTADVWATQTDQTYPTLYTEAPMRADKVNTVLRFDITTFDQFTTRVNWVFTSLPYDCRLSDLRVIEGGNNLQWIIYKHSGQKRADAKFTEVWVKQTRDSVLHAGEGFIFTCGWNDIVDHSAAIEFPAVNNANKNRLFTTDDVAIPLQQYPAIADCHRSWNLIGNPYPCFYSTKYFEPSIPFVVYEKTWVEGWSTGEWTMGYKTYSPVDDDYLLAPYQAFFVQRPLGYNALNLPEYGRFLTVDEYEDFMGQLIDPAPWFESSNSKSLNSQIRSRRAASPRPPVGTMENRRVINLRLRNADGLELDRTRLVGNPDASVEYELACDATKLRDMADNSTLLYIIGKGNTNYAISEQPFSESDEVRIGMKLNATGEYTLKADFKTPYPELDEALMLVDLTTGHIQKATEPYTFTAQAGELTSRFVLSYGEATGIRAIDNGQLTIDNGQLPIYDLQGRRVNGQLQPGIYIRNGQKIIIK